MCGETLCKNVSPLNGRLASKSIRREHRHRAVDDEAVGVRVRRAGEVVSDHGDPVVVEQAHGRAQESAIEHDAVCVDDPGVRAAELAEFVKLEENRARTS